MVIAPTAIPIENPHSRKTGITNPGIIDYHLNPLEAKPLALRGIPRSCCHRKRDHSHCHLATLPYRKQGVRYCKSLALYADLPAVLLQQHSRIQRETGFPFTSLYRASYVAAKVDTNSGLPLMDRFRLSVEKIPSAHA